MSSSLLLLTVSIISVLSSSATVVDVAEYLWSGVGAYIVVDRQQVQKKLDDYHRLHTEAPKLSIPPDPVFRNLATDQHVVYIDFGFMSSEDFDNQPGIQSMARMMTFAIPYLHLSNQPEEGAANYTLAIGILSEKSDTDFYQPQLIPRFTPVEKFIIDSNKVSLEDEGQSIDLSYTGAHPCEEAPDKPPYYGVSHFATNDYIFDAGLGPDLDFCLRHPEAADRKHCKKMNDIRDDIRDALPNVCVGFSSASNPTLSCQVSLKVTSISPALRAFLLLGETGPIEVFAAKQYEQRYTSSFKYPCVDEQG